MEAARKPTIDGASSGCTAAQAQKLHDAYAVAAAVARSASKYTQQLALRCARGQNLAWHDGPAPRFFGDFRADKVRKIVNVFSGVETRFREGFVDSTSIEAPRIECFGRDHGRCRQGLLANASIFGTIRVCPSLLERSTREVALVLLHEMLHQGLGVGDRRHPVCRSGKKRDMRCYREGAVRLVEEGRSDLALQNNDNYVGFALALANIPGEAPV
ncbi:hypothetical protein ACNOYE_18735 [Nannocystaceae bacterium ST9]